MKNLLTLLPIVLLVVLSCKAQQNAIHQFVPKGYTIYSTHYGHLNQDTLTDCVILIKKIDPNNIVVNRFNDTVDRNRRGIIVLINQGKTYQMVAKNDTCFYSENEDGGIYFPPELMVNFKNNNLVLHFGHGRYGFWQYIFRFQNETMALIGYDYHQNFGPITQEITSINFLTKKKLIKKNLNADYDDKEEVFKETWYNITIDSLIKLNTIASFENLKMHQY